MEDVFFRALYLVASKTPTLMAANALTHRIFGNDPPEPFMPHLSLFYGDKPHDAKRAIGDAIRPRLPASCDVRTLAVFTTEPPVEGWRLAHGFALSGANL